ncbi:DUF2459 domain-containing protein [Haloferula sp.]|uniref:DUF2459 domain-containing protein n=1 Tax=Haloferula sp. TaxID=2497595 RepID=UPI00329BC67F
MRSGVAQLFLLAIPMLMASCALHFPEEKQETKRVEMAARAEPVELASAPDVPVVMFADELHTGLILKLAWLKRYGYVPPPEIGNHEHVVFSWGDETAYVQERWLSPWQVIDALFLPSASVMEIIPMDWNIPEVMPTQRLYQGFAADSAGASLADFLNHCSVRNDEGTPLTIADSSWGKGRLIRSPHAYYFPRICNIWTVDALRAAGFSIGGLRGLSADGMVEQVTKPKNGFQQIWAPEWQMGEGVPDA